MSSTTEFLTQKPNTSGNNCKAEVNERRENVFLSSKINSQSKKAQPIVPSQGASTPQF
jgi:hypothetical protein